MLAHTQIKQAAQRISPYITNTPLTLDADYPDSCTDNLHATDIEKGIYFKWDNHQITGSFKARGAINKTLSISDEEQQRGLVTASAGNHGQGVALAAKIVGVSATIFIPADTMQTKIDAIRSHGAEIIQVMGGYGEAENAGINYANTNDATWISAYNDVDVIAGQGTLGLEVLKELPRQGSYEWFVPVGGGGLLSGIGAVLNHTYRTHPKKPKLIGVQTEASPFMYNLYHHGTQNGVIESPTTADGLAGPVEENSITIPFIRKYVDDIVLVTEEEIAQAVAFAWNHYKERIEYSSAAALAGVITGKSSELPAVVIISGGNIQPELHDKIVNQYNE